ncbi:Ldh family oxidoreductase [Quadrisphaera sp. DSM 44207]|uniref:Ldh family oxidoreductase n=1 Tax=Quadrisphaera sp. DSM 44207 TaxID=1881057 RepID=UPI000881F9A9|nr:Ldh family oxidoreductase [Quadrisphaera sp. DSM 44207]SDQ84757.1 malate dehydrogenase (NAD) /L-sulfolactate dehydrogenase [Quadrisphaera sp. DSM 44207]
MSEGPRFAPHALVDFGSAALQVLGVPEEDAKLTSTSLVEADRRGVHSHGVLRLPLYAAALRAGGITARPRLRWVREVGCTAVLDADGGLGQVAVAAAVRRALQLARSSGAAVVAVQRSTHYGAGAFWTDQLAAEGVIGVLTSTTGPTVAPYGGAAKVLGTNPLTVGIPSAGDVPLTADMATSAGAYGKVVAARDEGAPIPAGWAVDPQGRPTTDPAQAAAGALVPFGGHKGSALAVVLEALAASLTEATFAAQTVDIWTDPASRMDTGHLLVAVDTAAFTGREHTERRVAQLQEAVRSSGRAGAVVHAPGDVEAARAHARVAAVALARSTVEQLEQLARQLGLPLPDPLPDPATPGAGTPPTTAAPSAGGPT